MKETCKALWTVLQPEYVKAPSSKEDWVAISRQFDLLWNFPNCIRAIDGKHIFIQAPSNCGSYYYDYKGTRSIVLMAVVDAQYRFVCIDVGKLHHEGIISLFVCCLMHRRCHNDSGILANCSFGQALADDGLDIRNDCPLPGCVLIIIIHRVCST